MLGLFTYMLHQKPPSNLFQTSKAIGCTLMLVAAMPILAATGAPAQIDSATTTTLNTEFVISNDSAFERTRPFSTADKVAYFVNIKNGDKVRSPFRVAFVVSDMGVSPVKAGKIEGTGHHHILIDQQMPADIKAALPFDRADEFKNQRYKHYGKGETEAVFDLPPGKHTLRLLFADHNHVPYYISSKEISIEVLDKVR